MRSHAIWNVYWIPAIANNNYVEFNTSLRQQRNYATLEFFWAATHRQNYTANFWNQRNRLEFKIAIV
jgi:hypothetical protein